MVIGLAGSRAMVRARVSAECPWVCLKYALPDGPSVQSSLSVLRLESLSYDEHATS